MRGFLDAHGLHENGSRIEPGLESFLRLLGHDLGVPLATKGVGRKCSQHRGIKFAAGCAEGSSDI